MRPIAEVWRAVAWGALLLTLPGCATTVSPPPTSHEVTVTSTLLREIPAPKERLVVAIYGYPDLTGKFQSTDTVATFSHVVTQGAASVVVNALEDAGAGSWFTVVEREHLSNLVTERQIVREQRQNYKTPDGRQLPPLPPMLYAGLLFEGGVIGYDTNTVTGGLGANYLGIGGNVQYQEDVVTVYLRAVSTQTGQVLSTVMVRKKIVSYGVDANVFKFVAFQKLLQGETGYTTNEPGMVALREAVEKAVAALVVQGLRKNLWTFADPAAGQAFLERWAADEDDGDLAAGPLPVAARQDSAGGGPRSFPSR